MSISNHREIVELSTRLQIIASLVNYKLERSGLQSDSQNPLNYVSLATNTEGYLATDLHDLVSRAVHQATIRATKDKSEVSESSCKQHWIYLTQCVFLQTVLREEDFHSAQQDFTPLSLRDVKLQKSDVSWADIGGMMLYKHIFRLSCSSRLA